MKNFIIVFFALLQLIFVKGQDNEDSLKGKEDSGSQAQKVFKVFKSTRVINAHSTEMLLKGNLDFRILHRFNPVNSGAKDLFGFDAAYMRIAFDYGFTDNFMAGIGRSTFKKEYDAFVKARILRQANGPGSLPLSVLIAGGAMVYTQSSDSIKPQFSDRSAYYVQLIAGRKFSDNFSLQFSPILLHRNKVESRDELKTIFAIGGGAHLKLTRRLSLTMDYHHALKGLSDLNTDPLSVGIDIETGGHIFQLHFSNSVGMNERAYITETRDKFFNGDIRFGFNLSRVFKVRKKSM